MKRKARILVPLILVIVAGLCLTACANRPPIIHNIGADNDQVMASAMAHLTCDAVDPEKDPLTYSWTASSGTIVSHSPTATWTAPETPGTYQITVTAQDTHANKVSKQIELLVYFNAPPVIDSLIARPAAVGEGNICNITCLAHDPEGSKLTYYWSVEKGEIKGSGNSVTWLAPAGLNSCIFKVIASDESGNTTVMSDNVTVLPNHIPEIRNLSASPSSVVGGKTSLISCDASDADHDLLQFIWSATTGIITGDGNQVTWAAPNDCQQATITVMVSDLRGGTVSKPITISVHKEGG
jgi:hypothetical protein